MNSNFSQFIANQSLKYKDKTALNHRYHVHAHWERITWTDFAKKIHSTAQALIELGVQAQQCIGQFSQNKAENLVVDFAAYSCRDIVVPIYPTSTLTELKFIIENAEIEILFVGNKEQYQLAQTVLKDSKFLKKIIVFDTDVRPLSGENIQYYSDLELTKAQKSIQEELDQREKDFQINDIACILYTSGTSGISKGVQISHENLLEAMRIHDIRLTLISDKDRSLAYLPLTHIFERSWSYFCLFKGVEIFINHLPGEIKDTLLEVKPNYICTVPRFWEKVYEIITHEISHFSPIKQGFFTWALAIGQKYNFEYERIARKADWKLQLKYFIADKLIFSKIKHKLGIHNAKMLPIAGARLSDELIEFFMCMGIPIIYGYGLTESTATVCCFDRIGYKIGTLGSCMPDVNVKIGPNSEILLKGKTITSGYYKNEQANQEAFTKDGWFKTGDAGHFEGHNLILTDRIKDLYKTSNGKFIAPQKIEAILTMDRYIDQIAVIGDDRNYITALIVPVMNEIIEYAKKHKIVYENADDLLKSQAIYELIDERIKFHQKDMVQYEHIRRFALIPQQFSIETGELTNTLKVRRAVIMQKYKYLIESMY